MRCEPRFDFASDEYADLFARSSATAFQHPIWLDALVRHVAPARGAKPVVVTGRDPAGRLTFALPLIVRRPSGVALLESADLGVSDYSAPVVAGDFLAPDGLAGAVARALPPHDILRLKPARPDAATGWQLFFDCGCNELDFGAHATELASTYEAWRERAYAPSFAKYLDRRRRKFWKSEGAQLRLLSGETDIRAAIDMIRDQRAGRFEGDPIQQPPVRDFYAEVAVKGASAGFARTYALMLGGEAIGHVFGLTHAGRFHYLLIGCDYERHGRHSPGLVMYDAMIADWIAAGGTCFDFTIGDEAFKADFGTVATPMTELVATPTWKGRLARAAFDARAQLRRLRETGRAGHAAGSI